MNDYGLKLNKYPANVIFNLSWGMVKNVAVEANTISYLYVLNFARGLGVLWPKNKITLNTNVDIYSTLFTGSGEFIELATKEYPVVKENYGIEVFDANKKKIVSSNWNGLVITSKNILIHGKNPPLEHSGNQRVLAKIPADGNMGVMCVGEDVVEFGYPEVNNYYSLNEYTRTSILPLEMWCRIGTTNSWEYGVPYVEYKNNMMYIGIVVTGLKTFTSLSISTPVYRDYDARDEMNDRLAVTRHVFKFVLVDAARL